MRILLVEDDQHLGTTLNRALDFEGYVTDWVTTIAQAKENLDHGDYDMMVLDWMLPDCPGIDFLRELRRDGKDLPVLMLTAKVATTDKIEGLDAGADDYLTKPFDLDELFARLRSLQRRGKVKASRTLIIGAIRLDPDSRDVHVDGNPITLSRSEFAILEKLMENKGRYLSKIQLEHSIYHLDNIVTPNAIEAHISRLRKRLGANSITTLRGVGYRINTT